MLNWLFRDRTTGRITIAQFPNVSIALVVVLVVIRWLFSPQGVAGDVVDIAAGGALVWWSGDEILRGVNPFRRILGGAVLALVVADVVRRLA
jgi:hypothetical protein